MPLLHLKSWVYSLILDNVRQSIANFSYIYTFSLPLKKIEKKGKKEEIRKEEKFRFFFC